MMCGKCHRCGNPIVITLDGEEWCEKCQMYQRPLAHGWVNAHPTREEWAPCEGEAGWQSKETRKEREQLEWQRYLHSDNHAHWRG